MSFMNKIAFAFLAAAFLIVPLFALANTGVPTPPGAVVDAATSTLGQAIFVGLVIGKPVGIVGASWIAVKLGIATLPKGVTWPDCR